MPITKFALFLQRRLHELTRWRTHGGGARINKAVEAERLRELNEPAGKARSTSGEVEGHVMAVSESERANFRQKQRESGVYVGERWRLGRAEAGTAQQMKPRRRARARSTAPASALPQRLLEGDARGHEHSVVAKSPEEAEVRRKTER